MVQLIDFKVNFITNICKFSCPVSFSTRNPILHVFSVTSFAFVVSWASLGQILSSFWTSFSQLCNFYESPAGLFIFNPSTHAQRTQSHAQIRSENQTSCRRVLGRRRILAQRDSQHQLMERAINHGRRSFRFAKLSQNGVLAPALRRPLVLGPRRRLSLRTFPIISAEARDDNKHSHQNNGKFPRQNYHLVDVNNSKFLLFM